MHIIYTGILYAVLIRAIKPLKFVNVFQRSFLFLYGTLQCQIRGRSEKNIYFGLLGPIFPSHYRLNQCKSGE